MLYTYTISLKSNMTMNFFLLYNIKIGISAKDQEKQYLYTTYITR